MPPEQASVRRIADRLREAAELLEEQGANRYRVAAYRHAADTLDGRAPEVQELYASDGVAGLCTLPGIGASLGAAIAEMIRTGRWAQLERLRGEADPEKLFRSIPGVGRTLARRLVDELHVESLEALETAAYDGRLEGVPGVGRRRAAMLRANLASMLARTRRPRESPAVEPDTAELLAVDREYREKAARGALPTIAPRRFNPQKASWLPVLHTLRGVWHYTAMFSNTARAHELGRTGDWVVIYFHTDDHVEGQRTVVTETRGPRQGERVVRGREAE